MACAWVKCMFVIMYGYQHGYQLEKLLWNDNFNAKHKHLKD